MSRTAPTTPAEFRAKAVQDRLLDMITEHMTATAALRRAVDSIDELLARPVAVNGVCEVCKGTGIETSGDGGVAIESPCGCVDR